MINSNNNNNNTDNTEEIEEGSRSILLAIAGQLTKGTDLVNENNFFLISILNGIPGFTYSIE